ncbi:hypothetical protein [Mobilicoccus caccae]|uniref:Uncharacterized protein n=1 Tax=Mobilicoccus caccae TaxID=1859295 RepID=A0ABQ6IYH1_9MICO|nr:hypothetical protein [Mobilicoccus caccae]GMA42212.1 hypothetical protein GCM10025883_42570 [Mobilicoccus caccae]
MDIDALFDRMASELETSGAREDTAAPVRTLHVDGTPFARLADEGAEVYLPEGSPAREDALGRRGTAASADGWVLVTSDDVSAWPGMFEQALHGLRR